MRVKSIHLRSFMYFTDLKIQGLNPEAKLIVLLGPNGSGKSCIFDAIHQYSQRFDGNRSLGKWSANKKWADEEPQKRNVAPDPEMEFYEQPQNMKGAIHARTAYRNEPNPAKEIGPPKNYTWSARQVSRMASDDRAISQNYKRLLCDAAENDLDEETTGKSKTLQKIKEVTKRTLQVELNSPKNISQNEGLTFNKKGNNGIPFENLSAGEKAAFDLILDIIMKERKSKQTLFCIDEPENHINPRMQSRLLEQMINLLNEKSQIWIATHSIGMMRKAMNIWKMDKSKVQFINLENINPSEDRALSPTEPSRQLWENAHKTILEDLAMLVAPDTIIVCEGEPGGGAKSQFDANCYNKIFGNEYPNKKFVSAGGKGELKNFIAFTKNIAAFEVFAVRDKDTANRTVAETLGPEVKILKRRTIEEYLLGNEALETLCNKFWPESPERLEELITERDRHNGAKPAKQHLFHKADKWGIEPRTADPNSFLKEVMANLIRPGKKDYEELKQTIFGQKE